MRDRSDKTCPLTRRAFVGGVSSLFVVGACTTGQHPMDEDLRRIELSTGGRTGVAAINLATGQRLAHRGDERFAMCSTFKWLLAAFVLHKVDQHEEQLDRKISYTEDDLVFYSPVTKPRVAQGAMTIGELCGATLKTSDNTAANLLLFTIGGPAGFTAFARAMGDSTTRLDRLEPQLNENAPGDVRDTTTPNAMLKLMQTILFGSYLSIQSKGQLQHWMMANTTGLTRLRAGIPENWLAGDRTGTSEKNANNNLAFAIAPEHTQPANGPLLIVSFTNAPNPVTKQANAIHAQIARHIVNKLV